MKMNAMQLAEQFGMKFDTSMFRNVISCPVEFYTLAMALWNWAKDNITSEVWPMNKRFISFSIHGLNHNYYPVGIHRGVHLRPEMGCYGTGEEWRDGMCARIDRLEGIETIKINLVVGTGSVYDDQLWQNLEFVMPSKKC